MIEIGKKQTLTVVKKTDFGIYLGEEKKEEKVLLPIKQVPENTEIGDQISVFIYRDSEDRLIATTREPLLTVGEIAVLHVKEVTEIGAFLDWGLEKDLFLPYKEQLYEVKEEKSYPVALYVDKSKRLCATMHVSDYLRCDSPYQKEDVVRGIVYRFNPEYGAFIAVDAKYEGMIPIKELASPLHIGEAIEGRVTNVRPDGKLDLSIRKKAYEQMEEDAKIVLEILDKYQGILPFTDKTVSPERIRNEFALTKNAFKRAVGKLLKEKKIKITEQTIEKL